MSLKREIADVDEALNCLAKARAIVDIVGKQITADLGFDDGAPYSDSLWAAADSLERLHAMLEPPKTGEGMQ